MPERLLYTGDLGQITSDAIWLNMSILILYIDMSGPKQTAAYKIWIKNKANPYPCSICGRMTNKSAELRHSRTMVCRLAAFEIESAKPEREAVSGEPDQEAVQEEPEQEDQLITMTASQLIKLLKRAV